jgi:glutathione-specific gamma-glutamylcyclotransferase
MAALYNASTTPPPPNRDLWVFAYGSLMWNPGFHFEESRPALLRGWHRRFCTWSIHYRGTPERPGLVLGLDRGGSCRGMAFRVAAAEKRRVVAYLYERELIYAVYEPRVVPLTLAGSGARVAALAFVVDRGHPSYAGAVPADRVASTIAEARGQSGSGRDYLAQTVARLDALGLEDRRLARLLAAVDARPAGA